MKHIFILAFAIVLLAAGSCSKKNMAQSQVPVTVTGYAPGDWSYTDDFVITQWAQTTENNYIYDIGLPHLSYATILNIKLFAESAGNYLELTNTPVNFLQGQLWFENHYGENILIYHSEVLPPDSLNMREIVTLSYH
jgi:hypothetical protein